MSAKPFLIISILMSSSLKTCQPSLVIEKERAPSAQVLPTATGSGNLPVLEGDDAADLPSVPLRPEPHLTVEAKDVGTPEGVVIAFLNTISEGNVNGAKRFWIPEVWNEGIDQLVDSWATGKHEIAVGPATYAGLVAPGDYRPLDAEDPRVQDALVEASIGVERGSFALEKTSCGWLISGWVVSDVLEQK